MATISQKDNHKYIKEFDFQTPVKTKKEFSFKNIKLTIYPTTANEITVSFKDTKKNYQISTDFLIAQDILRIESDGHETFICWSKKAKAESKLETTVLF